MEIQGGGGAPYIQVAYQPTAYNQVGGLANQMGQLNLQDPAFLQELQRLEQPHQLQQHQLIQQPVQQLQAVPAYNNLGGGAGGPGNHLPPPTTSPGHTSAKTRNHEEVGELAPEEVRWFYKKEVDKPWIVFDGYDSLRIEIRYRHIWQTRWRSQNMAHGRRAQSLNRYYDRSAGESYSGSSDEYNYSDPSQQYSRQQTFNSHPPRRKFSPSLAARHGKISKRHYRSEELIGDDRDFYIVVRGGIYEVDLNEWKCNSVYWPGPGLEIMRGTWFHDTSWQPVDCEHADRIEAEHIKRFMGHKMADYIWDPTNQCRREVMVQHTMQFPGEYRVEWMSPEETYMHLDSAGSKIYRGLVESVGMKKSAGYRIFRGFKEVCNAAERLPDVSHVVFVVHGVGGVMDEGTIGRNASAMRENVSHILTKCFPKFQEQSGQRVEFFPVEWRSNLRLDEGLVEAITPQRILGLRTLLNSTGMDIMYYTSPLFRMEIWAALQHELNRLYEMFTTRNPHFEANGGKVSIISHSLGCVITYDILSGWTQEVEHSWYSVNAAQRRQFWQQGLSKPPVPPTAESGLIFRIENFFCLGSPLPVFLSLRWRDPTNTDYHDHILPRDLVKFLYNVYHPCDPVAYRIEPIFMKIYAQIEPNHIYPWTEQYKVPYGQLPLQPLVRRDPPATAGDAQQLPVNIANGTINVDIGKMGAMAAGGQGGDQSNGLTGWLSGLAASAVSPAGGQPGMTTSMNNGQMFQGQQGMPLQLPDGKRLAYRMDYCVRESGNSYVAAVTSHTSYWANKDIAFFILTKMFPELENIPMPPNVN